MVANSPLLHQIEKGEDTGPKALEDIVTADAQQVDRAEGMLGESRQSLAENQVLYVHV